jgi:hypothetical protein
MHMSVVPSLPAFPYAITDKNLCSIASTNVPILAGKGQGLR